MTNIKVIPFNHYQVNTTILWNDDNECVIVDAACSPEEQSVLKNFIDENNLKPVKILLTHAHPDHLEGLRFVCETYNLPVTMHKDGLPFFKNAEAQGEMMGFHLQGVAGLETEFVNDGDIVAFGESLLKVLYCPGHCPGSLCYYSEEAEVVIAGDVLFNGSIGRTDLPGGDYDVLMNNIKTKLLVLADSCTVITGHGPLTTIGDEKMYNPFLS